VFTFLPALFLLFAAPSAETLDQQIKKIVDVFSIVRGEAADPVEADKAFYEGAIPGMLKKLDPHSVFFDPQQFEQLQQMERSERKGFGSVVSLLPGRVIVLQTLPNTPSARSGISPGDEILGINGIRLDRLQVEQLVQLLTESRQQKVELMVRRPGNARLMQFTLTPETVDSPSVDRAFLLRPGIAFVRVASFDIATGKQLQDAIEKLGGSQLKGLVLDLRNNPGGVMSAALDTATLFLQPKQRILTIRGRAKKDDEANVKDSATPYTFPVAVVINGKSASASEIVAGALQDHDRASIVGEPSFGKGLVQSVYPLSHNTGLALTTAFYYTPSGRSIQHRLTGALDEATKEISETKQSNFHSDSGRVLNGGSGGIQPDQVVYPLGVTPLGAVLETSGAFPTFATEWLKGHSGTGASFEVSNEMLDQFQLELSQNNIRPSIGDWSKESEWIRSRLKQEILNQAVGVEKGDEVEMQVDPQVKAARAAIASR
jgi:carboxyl-terminal processing protease